MQVEVKIDAAYPEPKVLVLTKEMNGQVSEILDRLSDAQPQMLVGFEEEKMRVLDQEEIVRVYAAAGKVYAVTDQSREYRLRLRLYEVEERLGQSRFVRISNSEIINLKKVRHFDLSFTGTICVSFQNDTKTYVSRRYVAKVKQKLGV